MRYRDEFFGGVPNGEGGHRVRFRFRLGFLGLRPMGEMEGRTGRSPCRAIAISRHGYVRHLRHDMPSLGLRDPWTMWIEDHLVTYVVSYGHSIHPLIQGFLRV